MNRLLTYLNVVTKWRRFVFYNCIAITLLGVLVSFLIPMRYAATAQLLPPSDEGSMLGLSGILGGGLSTSSLSKLRMGAIGGGTASDLMVGILESRTVVQNVADRCSLARYYRIKPVARDRIAKELRRMTRLDARDDGIVSITVEAKTRFLAANLANTYMAELDSFLRRSNISRGRNMRLFVERRLVQVDSSLAMARESLRVFQQEHKVVSVDDETKAAIEAYAEMKSKLTIREAELEAARSAASDDNPYVINLDREVSGLRGELGKLERGGSSSGFGVGFGVSFDRLPAVAAQFLRHYQDFKIQEEAYAMLYQQYEYARILEARDAPSLSVLDVAVPPQRHSSPKRVSIILVIFAFSLAAGTVVAFLLEYFEQLRSSRPDEHASWMALRGVLVTSVRTVIARKKK